MSRHEQTWAQISHVPRDFLHGLIGGLLAPLLGLAGIIGLIFAFTHRLPAVKEVLRSNGERERAIVLASRADALASWSRYGGELPGALVKLRSVRRS